MSLTLWTIQEEKRFEALKTEGVLRGEAPFVPPYFKDGYDWMKNQMAQRIGPSEDSNQYPVWAWYQAHSISKRKPDLRESAHLPAGTIGYRLEFRKKASEVLLSDFETWHAPLTGRYYIADSERESLEFASMLKQEYGTDTFSKLPRHIRDKIEKSWEKVFDMEFDVDYYTQPFENKCIQATFWELTLDEVTQVDRFVAR